MKNIITWDLGRTKCAAALVKYDPKTQDLFCDGHHSVKLKSCFSLTELVEKLEHSLDFQFADADAICIGAAGQYDGEQLHHTMGYPYPMHMEQLARDLHWPKMAVVHDYTPIVCATFTSYMHTSENLMRLNLCEMNPLGRRVALGVGTGLGAKDGILFSDGNFWLGTNEVGHIGVSAPPLTDYIYQKRHQELIAYLRSEGILAPNEPLCFEKILSGQGIVRIHRFLNLSTHDHTPEEIGGRISDGLAEETLLMFAWYLGLFLGTMQLIFMPEGGMWITGGVVLKHLKVFECQEFLRGIEASPAYMSQRHQIPMGVMCNPEHAFMGGAYYAVKRLLEA